jgi:predicted lipid-binding transport protein (Tim44 family)
VDAFAAARIGIVPRVQLLRRLAAFLFIAFGLLLWSEEADARLGRGAAIVDGERVIGLSEPSLLRHEESSPCAAQQAYPAGSLGGLFSRPGLIGGFAAGFLGAGIFGLLFGHGVIGELSGVPSVFGLLFQFALLVAFGWLIWGWWRADRAAAVAQLSPRELADAYRREREGVLPELGTDAKDKSETKDKNSFADKAQLPL